ncbi:hypothetical protein SeLEV6574_g06562 [Synchytrium endobioticum]|uniref:MARVEL domain-containing protein n=1 Tax=Synchytrium endobioticum TaxID=286115 RepID=A0A507CN33_9FUNG|nr:hypothetical protein SeLEV6574_g06562 [Synchytrium endobioticum]
MSSHQKLVFASLSSLGVTHALLLLAETQAFRQLNYQPLTGSICALSVIVVLLSICRLYAARGCKYDQRYVWASELLARIGLVLVYAMASWLAGAAWSHCSDTACYNDFDHFTYGGFAALFLALAGQALALRIDASETDRCQCCPAYEDDYKYDLMEKEALLSAYSRTSPTDNKKSSV